MQKLPSFRSPHPPSPSTNVADDGTKTESVVGAIVASVAVAAIVAALLMLMYFRGRRRSRAAQNNPEAKYAAGAKGTPDGILAGNTLHRGKDSPESMGRENGEGKVTGDNTEGTGSPSPDGLRPALGRLPTDVAVYDQSPNVSGDAHVPGPGPPPTPQSSPSLPGLPEGGLPSMSSGLPSPGPVLPTPSSLHSSDPATVPSAAGSMANIRLYSPDANLSVTEALEDALDALHALQQPFIGQFLLLSSIERRSGGQGLVQFARLPDTPGEFAIKFYTHRAAFERESGLYRVEALRSMMPATHEILPNDGRDGQPIEVSPTGFAWPPCIVVERGESLDEWARRETPDFITIMQVCCYTGHARFGGTFLNSTVPPRLICSQYASFQQPFVRLCSTCVSLSRVCPNKCHCERPSQGAESR
jgi:hypothetical protein